MGNAALPFFLFGGVTVAALMSYFLLEDAEASPGPLKRDPKPVPGPGTGTPAPGSKLPTEPTGDPEESPEEQLPPNLFIVNSLATEASVAASALQQGQGREGVVLVFYRPAAAEIIVPEVVIAASSYPDATFLVYPEDLAAQLNPNALVSASCGPNDIVSVQGFPTVLTPAGPEWGPSVDTCVAQPDALELRAALSTAADGIH